MRGKISYGRYFTDVEHDICRNQARIFEEVAERGYDIHAFSDTYMDSEFCNMQFDALWSHYQMLDRISCLAVILPEIGDKLTMMPDDVMFDPAAAYWIGYTYRQLQIGTGIPSRELVKRVPFSILVSSYAGFHTLSEDMSFERLCECLNLPMKEEFEAVHASSISGLDDISDGSK